MLGLKLREGNECLSSGLVHVDRALVNTLLFFSFDNKHGLAVDDRNDRELFLWFGLFEATGCVPPGSFDLEAENVCAITRLLLWKLSSFPVHSLLYLSLNVQLVELNVVSAGSDLFNCGEERLWVVKSVDEGNVWLLRGVLLPGVQLLQSLLNIVQP